MSIDAADRRQRIGPSAGAAAAPWARTLASGGIHNFREYGGYRFAVGGRLFTCTLLRSRGRARATRSWRAHQSRQQHRLHARASRGRGRGSGCAYRVARRSCRSHDSQFAWCIADGNGAATGKHRSDRAAGALRKARSVSPGLSGFRASPAPPSSFHHRNPRSRAAYNVLSPAWASTREIAASRPA